MSTAVAPLPVVINPAPSADRGVMRGADMKARIDAIIDIADHSMKEGVDYGKVPGTEKPSLWQAGADKLCVAFQVAPKLRIEELSGHDEVRYRVVVAGVHQPTGIELGEGAGECSSDEEKYKWRFAVHQNEWDAMPADRRRTKYKRDGSTIQQVRTNPADVANTVLKMAIKRAKVAMALTVTGAAAVFTQDVEDLAEELRDQIAAEGSSKPETRQPQRRSTNGTAAASPSPKPLPADAKVALGLVKKVWPGEGNRPAAIVLAGSDRKYTTFKEDVAKEAKDFEGTDHQVKLAYTETVKGSNTYYNAVGISIADAEPQKPKAEPQQQDLTADDIFGGAGREPGQEG